MLQFLFNTIIWMFFYTFTAFVNVCIHELGHGIAAKMLGLEFRITIGEGTKLIQITKHFIILRNLSPFPYGYTDLYDDNNWEKYNKMSYKLKILFMSGGIQIQIISIVLITMLLTLKIGTNFMVFNFFYKFMILTSLLLLLIVLIPSSKRRTDSFIIYNLIKDEKKRRMMKNM